MCGAAGGWATWYSGSVYDSIFVLFFSLPMQRVKCINLEELKLPLKEEE